MLTPPTRRSLEPGHPLMPDSSPAPPALPLESGEPSPHPQSIVPSYSLFPSPSAPPAEPFPYSSSFPAPAHLHQVSRLSSGDDFSPGAAADLPRSVSTDSLNPGAPSPSSASSPLAALHDPDPIHAPPLPPASYPHPTTLSPHAHHPHYHHHPQPPALEPISEQKRSDGRKAVALTSAAASPASSTVGGAGLAAAATLQRSSSGRKEGQREGEEKESPSLHLSAVSPAAAAFTHRPLQSVLAHPSLSLHQQPVGLPVSPRDERGHLPSQSLDRSALSNHSPHAHSHTSPLPPLPSPHPHASPHHSHSSFHPATSDSSSSSLESGSHKVRAAVEESPDAKWARYPIRLGSGTFKEVWLAIDTETGKEVAWNVVDFRRVALKDQKRILQETTLLTQLRHPHIIECYDAWQMDVNGHHQLCFITQKSSYTLKQHIANLHPAKVKVIKKYCRQILSALAYLHSLTPPIIHRDIKADNIFIDGTTGDIRIGDFGLSISSSNPTSIVGTPGFLSPEMFGESYNELVDIWSFGMCALEMATNQYPYVEYNGSVATLLKKGFEGAKPEALASVNDPAMREFICMCLQSADKRPSAKDLLEQKVFDLTEPVKALVPVASEIKQMAAGAGGGGAGGGGGGEAKDEATRKREADHAAASSSSKISLTVTPRADIPAAAPAPAYPLSTAASTSAPSSLVSNQPVASVPAGLPRSPTLRAQRDGITPPLVSPASSPHARAEPSVDSFTGSSLALSTLSALSSTSSSSSTASSMSSLASSLSSSASTPSRFDPHRDLLRQRAEALIPKVSVSKTSELSVVSIVLYVHFPSPKQLKQVRNERKQLQRQTGAADASDHGGESEEDDHKEGQPATATQPQPQPLPLDPTSPPPPAAAAAASTIKDITDAAEPTASAASATSSPPPPSSSSGSPPLSTAGASSGVSPPFSLPSSPVTSGELTPIQIESYDFSRDNYLAVATDLVHQVPQFSLLELEGVEELVAFRIEEGTRERYNKWQAKARTTLNSEIMTLLTSLGIGLNYAVSFIEQEVSSEDLLYLSEEDLVAFIPKLGPRRRLQQYIAEVKAARRLQEVAEEDEGDAESEEERGEDKRKRKGKEGKEKEKEKEKEREKEREGKGGDKKLTREGKSVEREREKEKEKDKGEKSGPAPSGGAQKAKKEREKEKEKEKEKDRDRERGEKEKEKEKGDKEERGKVRDKEKGGKKKDTEDDVDSSHRSRDRTASANAKPPKDKEKTSAGGGAGGGGGGAAGGGVGGGGTAVGGAEKKDRTKDRDAERERERPAVAGEEKRKKPREVDEGGALLMERVDRTLRERKLAVVRPGSSLSNNPASGPPSPGSARSDSGGELERSRSRVDVEGEPERPIRDSRRRRAGSDESEGAERLAHSPIKASTGSSSSSSSSSSASSSSASYSVGPPSLTSTPELRVSRRTGSLAGLETTGKAPRSGEKGERERERDKGEKAGSGHRQQQPQQQPHEREGKERKAFLDDADHSGINTLLTKIQQEIEPKAKPKPSDKPALSASSAFSLSSPITAVVTNGVGAALSRVSSMPAGNGSGGSGGIPSAPSPAVSYSTPTGIYPSSTSSSTSSRSSSRPSSPSASSSRRSSQSLLHNALTLPPPASAYPAPLQSNTFTPPLSNGHAATPSAMLQHRQSVPSILSPFTPHPPHPPPLPLSVPPASFLPTPSHLSTSLSSSSSSNPTNPPLSRTFSSPDHQHSVLSPPPFSSPITPSPSPPVFIPPQPLSRLS